MRIVKGITIAALAVLAMAGCGSSTTSAPDPDEHRVGIYDNIMEQVYTYDGKPLHCVTYFPSTQSGMMSCDFVRYHAENG